MEDVIKKIPVFRIRAFNAVKDPESCEKFLKGHARVLESIGVNKVTSSTHEWVDNPDVYVFIAEDIETNEVYGGGRIHVINEQFPLPIQTAVSELDPCVNTHVMKMHKEKRAGELCGLWNSRKVAGLGLGAVFLARAGLAILSQIKVGALYSLCASYTVQMGLNLGFHIVPELGKDGTFYYPKLDLLATVLLQDSTYKLEEAIEEERQCVLALRNTPNCLRTEYYRKRTLKIQYQLQL